MCIRDSPYGVAGPRTAEYCARLAHDGTITYASTAAYPPWAASREYCKQARLADTTHASSGALERQSTVREIDCPPKIHGSSATQEASVKTEVKVFL